MKNKSCDLCLCLGYESLVIPLTLLNNQNNNVLVCTNREDIKKFCKLTNINYISIPKISFKDAITTPALIKGKINKTFADVDMKNSKIHFTHKNFDTHSLIIASYLHHNKIYFHRTEIDIEKEHPLIIFPYNRIKSNIYALLFNWFIHRYKIKKHFGLNITYRYRVGAFIPVVKDNWLKNNVEIIQYENVVNTFYNAYSKFRIDFPKCRNLLLDTDIKEMAEYVEKQSLINVQEYVLKQGAFLKGHPNRNFKNNYEKQYPSYIPAELLVSNTSNAIISLTSFAFRYSAQVLNKKTISLMELVEWTDQEQKSRFRKNLNDFGGNILYPETYEELANLMNE